MAAKIYAQVTIKPNIKRNDKKFLSKGINNAIEAQPSKVQLKKAEKKLLEAGCEITSTGPTIGIAMEISEFNALFGTKLEPDILHQEGIDTITVPDKLKDIIADVAIATLPDYY